METDSLALRCRVGAVDGDWPGRESRRSRAFERVIHETNMCQHTVNRTILQKVKLTQGASGTASSP